MIEMKWALSVPFIFAKRIYALKQHEVGQARSQEPCLIEYHRMMGLLTFFRESGGLMILLGGWRECWFLAPLDLWREKRETFSHLHSSPIFAPAKSFPTPLLK